MTNIKSYVKIYKKTQHGNLLLLQVAWVFKVTHSWVATGQTETLLAPKSRYKQMLCKSPAMAACCLQLIAVASTQQFHPCKTFGVSRENTIIWDWSHIRTPNLGASLMRPHTFNELFISSNREYFWISISSWPIFHKYVYQSQDFWWRSVSGLVWL